MGVKFRYITREQYNLLLADVNIENDLEQGTTAWEDIYEEALGQFEADMSSRFILPLRRVSGAAIEATEDYTRLMVQSTLKHKIRQVIGVTETKNVVINEGEKYIDVQAKQYNINKNMLLSHKRPYDLKLQDFAEGAKVPVQDVGIARADNDLQIVFPTGRR